MKDSKLYQTLSTFDVYELNRLKKFVDSPYFNSNDRISHLFDLMYDHFKNNNEGELLKEELAKTVFGKEDFEDKKFRKLASDLLKLVESFLTIEEFEKQPLHQANNLLRAVHHRKIEKLYNTTVKNAQRLAERQPDRSANYFLQKYQIEKNFYELSQAELNRAERSNIDEIIENLDYFYLSEKLKYYCTLLSRKKIQKHKYNILFIDEILDHIGAHDYNDQPQILIYYNVYKLYESYKNQENFFKLKSLIKKHQGIFTTDDLRDIYLAAINFSIANLNKGNTDFLKETYIIYKEALNAEALYIDGELSPWSYKNIVITGLRVGEDEWVESFIESYQKRLNRKHRDNAVKFNKARLHYYRKEFDKVIPLLNEVEFTDFSYNLGAKAMLLASFYELDEIDTLFSFLESFRVYLNRHRQSLPETRRKNYLSLIKYVKRLANIIPGDKVSLKMLEKEVEENVKVKADVNWLKEKIRELEGKPVH